jgi:hypothetical protein
VRGVLPLPRFQLVALPRPLTIPRAMKLKTLVDVGEVKSSLTKLRFHQDARIGALKWLSS